MELEQANAEVHAAAAKAEADADEKLIKLQADGTQKVLAINSILHAKEFELADMSAAADTNASKIKELQAHVKQHTASQVVALHTELEHAEKEEALQSAKAELAALKESASSAAASLAEAEGKVAELEGKLGAAEAAGADGLDITSDKAREIALRREREQVFVP